MENENPKSSLDEFQSFELEQLKILKSDIEKINRDMENCGTFQIKEKQGLLRLKISSLREYRYLKQLIACKEKSKKPKAETHSQASEIPPIPDRWRTDCVAFAQEALNIELFEHQKQLCLSEKRVNILIAGRGAGKSVAARVKAVHNACLESNHTVLVVSSGQRMSSDFGSKLLDLIRETPIREWADSITLEQVKWKNGSVIKFLPANPDTIRGYHPKSTQSRGGMTVILDEACFMEQGDEIRKAVEYALITTPRESGHLYIVSSPSTVGSWVHDYVEQADKPDADIAVIQCPSMANPTIPPEEIERLRATKNELEYRAEVLGEWVEGAFGLFSGLIDPNRIPGDAPPVPAGAICALGADLALSYNQTHDRNALAVVARWFPDGSEDELEARYRVLDLAVLDQASDREIHSVFKRFAERYNLEYAAIEQYQGKALAEFSQTFGIETRLIAPSPGLQQTVFHELHRLLRQGLLELPDHLPSLFFEEMKAFEYRREPNGHVAFGHPSSGKMHDDTVYALAWAIHAAGLVSSHSPPRVTLPLIDFLPQ